MPRHQTERRCSPVSAKRLNPTYNRGLRFAPAFAELERGRQRSGHYGRGGGVGRARGVGVARLPGGGVAVGDAVGLPVAVAVAVDVAVAVGVGVGVGPAAQKISMDASGVRPSTS